MSLLVLLPSGWATTCPRTTFRVSLGITSGTYGPSASASHTSRWSSRSSRKMRPWSSTLRWVFFLDDVNPVQEARRKMLASAYIQQGDNFERMFDVIDASNDQYITFL